MLYKDLSLRRACVRDSVKRHRARRAADAAEADAAKREAEAAAAKLEAAGPGEKQCTGCGWRRCSIAVGARYGAQFCRTCARDVVMFMTDQFLRTTEPTSQERCRLCSREPGNPATVSFFQDAATVLCRLCATEVAAFMVKELGQNRTEGLHRAA